ncbi:MAG: hypothetical protein LBB38_01380, partial [Puniceicoccales bacterium]|nr:hypothetical protein [Puniceicoccales bacterium]
MNANQSINALDRIGGRLLMVRMVSATATALAAAGVCKTLCAIAKDGLSAGDIVLAVLATIFTGGIFLIVVAIYLLIQCRRPGTALAKLSSVLLAVKKNSTAGKSTGKAANPVNPSPLPAGDGTAIGLDPTAVSSGGSATNPPVSVSPSSAVASVKNSPAPTPSQPSQPFGGTTPPFTPIHGSSSSDSPPILLPSPVKLSQEQLQMFQSPDPALPVAAVTPRYSWLPKLLQELGDEIFEPIEPPERTGCPQQIGRNYGSAASLFCSGISEFLGGEFHMGDVAEIDPEDFIIGCSISADECNYEFLSCRFGNLPQVAGLRVRQDVNADGRAKERVNDFFQLVKLWRNFDKCCCDVSSHALAAARIAGFNMEAVERELREIFLEDFATSCSKKLSPVQLELCGKLFKKPDGRDCFIWSLIEDEATDYLRRQIGLYLVGSASSQWNKFYGFDHASVVGLKFNELAAGDDLGQIVPGYEDCVIQKWSPAAELMKELIAIANDCIENGSCREIFTGKHRISTDGHGVLTCKFEGKICPITATSIFSVAQLVAGREKSNGEFISGMNDLRGSLSACISAHNENLTVESEILRQRAEIGSTVVVRRQEQSQMPLPLEVTSIFRAPDAGQPVVTEIQRCSWLPDVMQKLGDEIFEPIELGDRSRSCGPANYGSVASLVCELNGNICGAGDADPFVRKIKPGIDPDRLRLGASVNPADCTQQYLQSLLDDNKSLKKYGIKIKVRQDVNGDGRAMERWNDFWDLVKLYRDANRKYKTLGAKAKVTAKRLKLRKAGVLDDIETRIVGDKFTERFRELYSAELTAEEIAVRDEIFKSIDCCRSFVWGIFKSGLEKHLHSAIGAAMMNVPRFQFRGANPEYLTGRRLDVMIFSGYINGEVEHEVLRPGSPAARLMAKLINIGNRCAESTVEYVMGNEFTVDGATYGLGEPIPLRDLLAHVFHEAERSAELNDDIHEIEEARVECENAIAALQSKEESVREFNLVYAAAKAPPQLGELRHAVVDGNVGRDAEIDRLLTYFFSPFECTYLISSGTGTCVCSAIELVSSGKVEAGKLKVGQEDVDRLSGASKSDGGAICFPLDASDEDLDFGDDADVSTEQEVPTPLTPSEKSAEIWLEKCRPYYRQLGALNLRDEIDLAGKDMGKWNLLWTLVEQRSKLKKDFEQLFMDLHNSFPRDSDRKSIIPTRGAFDSFCGKFEEAFYWLGHKELFDCIFGNDALKRILETVWRDPIKKFLSIGMLFRVCELTSKQPEDAPSEAAPLSYWQNPVDPGIFGGMYMMYIVKALHIDKSTMVGLSSIKVERGSWWAAAPGRPCTTPSPAPPRSGSSASKKTRARPSPTPMT